MRSKGIKTVIIGGFLTNCCAGASKEEHANAITCDFPTFSTPMTSKDVRKQLR